MSNRRGVLLFIRAGGWRSGVLTLFVVSLIVFAATQVLPSDPAQAILGRNATPTASPRCAPSSGSTTRPFYQYTHWLKGIVTGDPGDSFNASVPILDYIGDRVVNSLFLLVLASVISIPLSLWIGAVQRPQARHDVRQRRRPTRCWRWRRCRSSSSASSWSSCCSACVSGTCLPAVSADRHRPRSVDRHEGDDPADRGAGARRGPVHLACRAGLDDRGARERLRRDGPTEGCAREGP